MTASIARGHQRPSSGSGPKTLGGNIQLPGERGGFLGKKKTRQKASVGSSRKMSRRAARKRAAAREQERAQEIGFLALAKEVAQENAETLRLLAKH
jgi:hypothetical protein